MSERDDEILQRCDRLGNITGKIKRGEAHGGGKMPHMAVHILVERPDGSLLLQKRSSAKKIDPCLWDTSVGGHVDGGEAVETAARRELQEELGISVDSLARLYDYLWESPVECERITTYYLPWDGPVQHSVEEIEEVKDWTVKEIRNAPREQFTENFLQELDRFLSWRDEGRKSHG